MNKAKRMVIRLLDASRRRFAFEEYAFYEPLVPRRKKRCSSCKKKSEWTTDCYLDGTDPEETLCPTCIRDSGYCMGCGQFWAGATDFDFSDVPGYCPNCADEIRSNDWGDDGDEDFWGGDDDDGDPDPNNPDFPPYPQGEWEPDPDKEYEAYQDRIQEEELELEEVS